MTRWSLIYLFEFAKLFHVALLLIVILKPSQAGDRLISNRMNDLEQKNYSIVDKINHFRGIQRYRSTDMLAVEWDQTLADDTARDVGNILNLIGCTAHLDQPGSSSWNCNDEEDNCGKDGDYLRLLMNQPGFHHVAYHTKDVAADLTDAVEYFYSNYYGESTKCGYWYADYIENEDECGWKHTYKMYSFTNRVGCAIYSCIQMTKGYQVMIHFACRFKALKTFRPYQNNRITGDQSVEVRTPLYTPIYRHGDKYICSECPKQAPFCHNNLCTSGTGYMMTSYFKLVMALSINIIIFQR